MSVAISGNPIHLPDTFRFDRERMRTQVNQRTTQFYAKNKEDVLDRVKHTVLPSVTLFSDTRAEMIKGLREEKGEYDDDIVDACAMSYAKLYSEIEERYQDGNELYYKADGTPLTKEEEIEWLNLQYEQEVEWQKANARVIAQGQVFMGNIPEVPWKEIEELEERLYQARDTYMKLWRGRFIMN